MKRLVLTVSIILLLTASAAIGCTNKELAEPAPDAGKEVVSSCVTCHTDKEILKEVAVSEVEDGKSEATSGEG